MVSDEDGGDIIKRWNEIESDPLQINPIYNWQPCEYSRGCLEQDDRLKTLPNTGWKNCTNNPSIEECWMHQYLEFAKLSE